MYEIDVVYDVILLYESLHPAKCTASGSRTLNNFNFGN